MELREVIKIETLSGAFVACGSKIAALSVVIPLHDEEASLPRLVGELASARAALPPSEVIFVDDGSSDGTARELRRLAIGRPWLRYVRHRRNCGQSAAIRTGVRAARHPWIATLDGDGQNDPADIAKLIAALSNHPAPERVQLVAGQRLRREDPWVRRLSSRIANAVRSRLLGDGAADTGCGLKLIRREAFLELPYFDHMHRFLPALIQRQGGEILLVPVSHRPRLAGRSHYGIGNRLWVGIVDLMGVLWLKRRYCRAEIEEGH
ncbi:glycosyltransferase family 2 protein [Pelomicrobium sp.]|jgi:dolichol-phosphate mannosyltransferase|uniref:glycosyltransferase family 2 protein n=1 Tax=Pelomicrobium sp. TaxID=2815319 RepID=UPI002FDD2554